jgi:hypothetical protein
MAKLLTDAGIARLKPKPGKRYDVIDPRLPGLIVHVTPTGSKSFMLKRRYPGSKHVTRRRIGEVGAIKIEQARETARQWLTWLDRGIDPAHEIAEQKRRVAGEQALTFAVVAEEYIARRQSGKRQGDRSAREIRKELVAAWGERRINAITRGDVVRLIDGIKARIDRNAEAANKARIERNAQATERRATHAATEAFVTMTIASSADAPAVLEGIEKFPAPTDPQEFAKMHMQRYCCRWYQVAASEEVLPPKLQAAIENQKHPSPLLPEPTMYLVDKSSVALADVVTEPSRQA